MTDTQIESVAPEVAWNRRRKIGALVESQIQPEIMTERGAEILGFVVYKKDDRLAFLGHLSFHWHY